jgi:hypothetical protein
MGAGQAAWLFRLVDLCAVAASAGLLLVARNRKVSAHRLHTLGLAYEILICFVIALVTYWQYYNDKKVLPNLTWVPRRRHSVPLGLARPATTHARCRHRRCGYVAARPAGAEPVGKDPR